MSDDGIDITAVAKLKHADLWAVCKRLGGQSALARELGANPWEVGRWVALQRCPPEEPTKSWPAERLRQLEIKLMELTGKPLHILFPAELRENVAFLTRPKATEKTARVRFSALLHYAAATTARLEHQARVELSSAEAADAVQKALKTLSYREKLVIEMRFGIGGGKPMTLAECGRVLKVTQERIRQTEAKAMRKLQGYRSIRLLPFDPGASEK